MLFVVNKLYFPPKKSILKSRLNVYMHLPYPIFFNPFADSDALCIHSSKS